MMGCLSEGFLACIRDNVASTTREVIVPLYMRHLKSSFWVPHWKKYIQVCLEKGTELGKGLEHKSSEKHLREPEGVHLRGKEAQGGPYCSLQLLDRRV